MVPDMPKGKTTLERSLYRLRKVLGLKASAKHVHVVQEAIERLEGYMESGAKVSTRPDALYESNIIGSHL